MTSRALFWDRIAESYAAKPVADPAAFERKIAAIQARMRPDHRVLDVGCGTGSLALRLAPHAAEVHALDLSSEMIRIARAKVEAAGVDNLRLHMGAFDEGFDALPEASLDGVCAMSLLHLVEDRAMVLRRVRRLLKPGGFFASSTVCLGDSMVPYGPVLTVMRWLGQAPEVWRLTRGALLDELRAAGFAEVEVLDVGAEATIAFILARRPLEGQPAAG